MYQAFYRKYRPRSFDDVAGQEHITQTLINQIKSGRTSHAYLFVGTRGTGKTTCAKILARAVNCERPVDGNPCNECPTCLSIESGQAPDVLELDAASNNGVDNVRALRDEAIFSPASTKLRVYIIDEVHMLSGPAFNALLKILEEPPEHLLFILATTELHKVPATVISRCQRFSFRRLPRDVIAERLLKVAQSEAIALSGDAAELLSRLSDGSMRDAISLLDQCAGVSDIDITRVRDVLGLPAQGEASRLLSAVARRDTGLVFKLLDELYSAGKQPASLFEELCELARDTLIAELIPGADSLLTGAMSQKELKTLGKSLPPARLMYILSTLTRVEFSKAASNRMAAEICLASLCDERLETSPDAFAARLEALEAGGFAMPSELAAEPQPVSEPPLPEPDISFASGEAGEPPPWDNPETVSVVTPEPAPKPVITAEPQPVEPDISFASGEADEPPPWDLPEPVSVVTPEPEPEPIVEPEPEIAVEPENVIESEPAGETPPSDDIWQRILSELPMSISAAITSTTAELDGRLLKISAFNAFTLNILNGEKTTAAIRETAAKLIGTEISIKTELSEHQPDAQIKLDDLSQRFGNLMKFE